jgi:hypothetical protein
MESWGPGRDNTYDHNLIHDTGNTQFGLQSGIYLDDASDHFTVTNNIIYGVIGAGSDQTIFAKGIGNKIHNNILVVAPTNTSAISSLYMADERCDHHEYTNNIIAFEDRGQSAEGARVFYEFRNWSADRLSVSDKNLFWASEGGLVAKGTPSGYSSFDNWLALGYDAYSKIGDPLFVDPANHDYRLEAGSPALKLGFEPIDTSKVGLKDDFPLRFARE